MNKYIKLQEANCRNCLRCVRVCPTKAMTYVNYQPIIIDEECILCGKCYAVCPHSAKSLNSELDKIKEWLNTGQEVVASIAPSFVAIWPDFNQLNEQLVNLGFKAVYETAVGAKIISEAYNELLDRHEMKNIISTCCPAVVSLVEREFPTLVDQLAPIVSPMIAHAKKIKEEHPNAKVVFVNPCIAKQKEAHDPRFAGIVDATLEMPDLAKWLESDVDNEMHVQKWSQFDGQIARIYPTPGGVVRTLYQQSPNYKLLSVEGVDRVKRTLQAISAGQLEGYFFEMSSCAESCIGGPLIGNFIHNEWLGQSVIHDNVDINMKIQNKCLDDSIYAEWKDQSIKRPVHDEAIIQDMLYMIGKTNKSKELDCGSCGYETCRDKAIAILDGKADPKICLPDALQHAQSVSNLVIRNTPNGIIVVNNKHEIQELNPAASHMLNLDSINAEGIPILGILPSNDLERILKSTQKVQYFKQYYEQYGLVIEHAVTYLADNEMYIVILMDMTVEEAKEKVIRNMQQNTIETAQKVIDDQMRTVQEVASLLGETTAKTKVALSKLMKAIDEGDG